MTQTAKNNLVNISIQRVASVDKGANRRTFALLKRSQEPPGSPASTPLDPPSTPAPPKGGSPVTNVAKNQKPDLTGMNAEQKAYVETLEKSAATPQVVTVSEEDDYETAISKMQVPEPVKQQLIKSEKRAREGERIAKAERDARRKNEHVALAKSDYAHLSKSADALGGLMLRLEDDLDEADYKEVQTLLKAANVQLEKGDLFAEHGDGGEDTEAGGAYADLQKKASELRKNDTTLSKHQAMVEATKQNPELAKRYKAEQGR